MVHSAIEVRFPNLLKYAAMRPVSMAAQTRKPTTATISAITQMSGISLLTLAP